MSGWTYDWFGPLTLPWVDGWFGPEPAAILPGQVRYLSTELRGTVYSSSVAGATYESSVSGSPYESHLEP